MIAIIIISMAPAVPNPTGGSAALTKPIAVKILSKEKTIFNKAICKIAAPNVLLAFPFAPSSSPSNL